MAIDILNLEPTTISRDLKGKFILLYGKAKAGKTSLAASFPNNLLLAFEIGYHALGGIHAQPVENWSQFKQVLSQLKNPKAQEKYHTITIDTVSIAYDMCEKWVCQNNDVDTIGDIPYGKGYNLVKAEFSEALRQLTLLGYGLVLIAHSAPRVEKVGDSEVEYIAPNLNKRAYEVANQLVDIIGYIDIKFNEDGTSTREIVTRQTPYIMAGSRFQHLAQRIPFGYESLANALADAIEASGEKDGATIVDAPEQRSIPMRPFTMAMEEAKDLFSKMNEAQRVEILASIKRNFGTERHQLSLTKSEQQPQLENVISDIKEMLNISDNYEE